MVAQKKITPKQEAFALAYCKLSNASDAYRAVYAPKKASAKTINEAACRLLKNSKIAARVAEVMGAAKAETMLSVERTLKEVGRLSHFDIRKLYDENGVLKKPHEWDDDTAAAISHIGRSGPVPFDKNSALDKSAKHLGLYEKNNSQLPPAVILHPPGKKTFKFEPFNGRSRGAAR